MCIASVRTACSKYANIKDDIFLKCRCAVCFIVVAVKDLSPTFPLLKANGQLYIPRLTIFDLVDLKIYTRLTPKSGDECLTSSKVNVFSQTCEAVLM